MSNFIFLIGVLNVIEALGATSDPDMVLAVLLVALAADVLSLLVRGKK